MKECNTNIKKYIYWNIKVILVKENNMNITKVEDKKGIIAYECNSSNDRISCTQDIEDGLLPCIRLVNIIPPARQWRNHNHSSAIEHVEEERGILLWYIHSWSEDLISAADDEKGGRGTINTAWISVRGDQKTRRRRKKGQVRSVLETGL